MNELQEVRTVDMVAAEIRALTSTMLSNIIEIGRRMCEAKEMVPYGSFGEWLEKNTGYSSSTANNFMRLYQEYGAAQGSLFGAEAECQTFGKLSYSKALALLAVPAEERESFAQQNDIESKSVREIKALIRERDDALQAAEGSALAMAELESQMDELRKREANTELEAKTLKDKLSEAEKTAEDCRRVANELAAENEELRNRPIDVAVQVDEEAVKKAAEEAKAAADAEWGKKLSKVEKAAEKQVKELEGKAAEADKLREQLAEEEKRRAGVVAPYEEQIAELRKQLAMSDAAVTAFRVHFDAMQASWGKAKEQLATMDAETAEKMRGALRALLKALEGQI